MLRLPLTLRCGRTPPRGFLGRRTLTTDPAGLYPTGPVPTAVAKRIGFAFDIDGVLLLGARPLTPGIRTLRYLNDNKVPWILLTNGGGKSEAARVADLSAKLEIDIALDQFVQSHTPFKLLANKLSKVLVVGGDGDICRHVAHSYGFKDVVMPVDIIATNKSIWPFHRFSEADLARAQPMTDAPIDGIFVYNDSRDWGCDTQIIVDVLLSQRGQFGTRNDELRQQVPIYFSNNDLLWANDYSLPRYGQGAFRACIESAYKEYTGADLRSVIIGKPFTETYDFADKVLREFRQTHGHTGELERVYMVGDNPASDIMGANSYGWKSMLVKTGVYREAEHRELVATPDFYCEDVFNAVRQALKFEETV
ncbi:HAD-like domain-containing protein [Dipodascopsis tothii]|uniref:HAD-like domain-containing protein n=1 Tax=Dipodascopsis tothii TaxID=44089 RepID=UPI0034CF686E